MAKTIDYRKMERVSAIRRGTGKTVTYFLLTLWAVMVLFPFYWMILSSVKSYSAYNAEYVPKLYTWNPTFQNYLDALPPCPWPGISSIL